MKTLFLHSKKHGDHEILYDDEDEQIISQHVWHIKKYYRNRNLFYAETAIYTSEKTVSLFLHRLILNITNSKIFIDHRDHNGLNNQKDNLRVCTGVENRRNSRKTTLPKSSQYKGVSWHKQQKHWYARITINNKKEHLGYFNTEEEAALAYNNASEKHYGEFGFRNLLPI